MNFGVMAGQMAKNIAITYAMAAGGIARNAVLRRNTMGRNGLHGINISGPHKWNSTDIEGNMIIGKYEIWRSLNKVRRFSIYKVKALRGDKWCFKIFGFFIRKAGGRTV